MSPALLRCPEDRLISLKDIFPIFLAPSNLPSLNNTSECRPLLTENSKGGLKAPVESLATSTLKLLPVGNVIGEPSFAVPAFLPFRKNSHSVCGAELPFSCTIVICAYISCMCVHGLK